MKKTSFLVALFALCLQQIQAEDLAVSLQKNASKEIPAVLSLGPVSMANLNLNKQGSVIIARPGEKIFSTINFSCNTAYMDPDALYQIVVGYEGVGPQKCIFNELGYRCKEGILSFFCEAPEEPGLYEVQCNLVKARSQVEALQSWWDEKEVEHNTKVTVGRIVVR